MASGKLSQEQKALQRQIATQQTIHLMQLVESPTASLEQEIQKEVDENPALEIYHDDDDERLTSKDDQNTEEYDANGDPLSLTDTPLSDEEIFADEYYRDEDIDEFPSEAQIENAIDRLNAPANNNLEPGTNVYYDSVHEKWQSQLNEMDLTDQQAKIAQYIVGNLDDSGYFTTNLQTVANELLYLYNIYTTADEVELVLTHFVQELDPAGTGARDLRECLLIQLKRLSQSTAVQCAKKILEQHFDSFLKKHYAKITQALSITDKQLKEALDIIKKLDPRPADTGNPLLQSADQITPDFIITAIDGKLSLSLNNQYIPKVRINKEFSNEYRFMTKEMSAQKRAEAEKFMQEYVDKGNQFIHSLSLREMILYNTMYAMMMHQQSYFLTGDDTTLKPMILKTIANEVKLDISTISRVSNSKYVQTDFGIIPLKHLFSEAVNDDNVSSKEIKQILSDVVAQEDKNEPYSDDTLCKMLADKGYQIARRTVAKYREQLNIPVARLRKEL